jgi:hypothetical protein
MEQTIILNSGQKIEVYMPDQIELDIDCHVAYIKSGQEEIQNYVDKVSKPEINSYVTENSEPLVREIVTQKTQPLIDEYVDASVLPALAQYVTKSETVLQQTENLAGSAAQAQSEASASAGSAKASADKAIEAAEQVDTLLANVVHKTGGEIITGTKTFTADVIRKNTNLDITTAPSSNVFTDFAITDKNGVGSSYLRNFQTTDGAIETQIGCVNRITGTAVSNWIRVGVDKDGNTFTKVTASSNTDSIVTTKGINKSQQGYVKLGNGIIIQWGLTVFAADGTTVTFPTAFTTLASLSFATVASPGDWGISTLVESVIGTSFTAHGYIDNKAHGVLSYWIAVGY